MKSQGWYNLINDVSLVQLKTFKQSQSHRHEQCLSSAVTVKCGACVVVQPLINVKGFGTDKPRGTKRGGKKRAAAAARGLSSAA